MPAYVLPCVRTFMRALSTSVYSYSSAMLDVLRHAHLYHLGGSVPCVVAGMMLALASGDTGVLHVPVVHLWQGRMTGFGVSRRPVTR